MLKKIKMNKFLSRVAFTIFVIFIMILTRYIPLPTVALDSYLVEAGSNLDLVSSATGANLAQISLTSLGLSPWMSSMILMRIFFLGKRKDMNMSDKQRNTITNSLILVLALLQATGFALNLDYNVGSSYFVIAVLQTILILVAGSFVLMWLTNLNADKGFGGMSIIILSNIILSRLNTFDKVKIIIERGYLNFLIFLAIWIFVGIFVIIVLEKAEYQVPVHRVSINNKYVEDSYIPLKLNISGGIAFMYAFSLLMIPQYLFLLGSYFFKSSSKWEEISSYFTTGTYSGVFFYSVVLFLLCISFAFVNVDILTLSKKLRSSGDFIEGVRPGLPTRRYLHTKVMSIGVLNGTILTFMSAFPMVLAVGNIMLVDLATMSGMVMMMSGMILMIIDEVNVIKMVKTYKSLFET